MLHSRLLGDAELEQLFGDHRYLATALTVERQLVLAQAEAGVVPEWAAQAVDERLRTYDPVPEEVLAEAADDGVFVPALVRRLRSAVGPELASYVHRGATSQDIVDTATVLILRDALELIGSRMEEVGDALAVLSEAHQDTVMLSRTRSQVAAVTTFGYKAAGWLAPFTRHVRRLTEMAPRLEVLSLGGASGNMAALGPEAPAVETSLARRLGLGASTAPWHNQRDCILEAGSWLAQVCASAAKPATDLILMAQNEIAEVIHVDGGSSSTLPGKSNPVRAEAIVALSRHAGAALPAMVQAAVHEHERGGAAWLLEWLALPQLMTAAGASLRLLREILDNLRVDAGRMRANIYATEGMALAEAAVFLLAGHTSMTEARRAVTEAGQSRRSGQHLYDVLANSTRVPVDWQLERDPLRHTGRASELAGGIVTDWRRRDRGCTF